MLNVLDEFTHECLAIRVARKLKAIDVIDVLSDLFILRGILAHIRSDWTGVRRQGIAGMDRGVGAKTAYIERGWNALDVGISLRHHEDRTPSRL
jgi:putative transposase